MKQNHKKLFRGDPLSVFIVDHCQLDPWFATIAIILLLNIPIIISASANEILYNSSNRIGLFQDYPWWLFQVTSFPATLLYFFWLPDGICGVLDGLKDNGALIPSKSKSDEGDLYFQFITKFGRSYSHRMWPILSVVVVISFLMLSIQTQKLYVNWQTSGQFIFWFTVFVWLFIFSVGLLGIIRFIISIVWMNRLFRQFNIDVKILHPDKAGGLSPLGDFSVKIGYLIGIYGISAVAAILGEIYFLFGSSLSAQLIMLLVAYVILAPTAFFAPIGTAHSAMKKAKEDFLLQISEQFEIDFTNVQNSLDADSGMLKEKLEKVEQLQKIYDIASRFPVWPFNTENLIRFFSSILSPLVLGLLPIIIEIFL